ncbi:MAG: leucyl aminopeptidase [Acidobacteria bacterium]|nr:MAG: leucyl aminopeptidase [Acidobacteriota bacterium]
MDVFACQLHEADTDLVIVSAAEEQVSELERWSAATGGEIGRAVQSGEFTGKLFETFLTPIVASDFRARRLAAVGLGPRSAFTIDRARRAATAIALTARQKKTGRIAFAADGALNTPDMIQAIAEGLTLAEFDAGRYKTTDYEPFALRASGIIASAQARHVAETAARRGRLIGEHCNMARQLDNEPGNSLTPPVFAARLSEVAQDGGLSVDVLDAAELERLGMGMLLGVGRGSAEPPRLVVIRYEPAGAPTTPVLGFVGKGITFDTGGISIKPPLDMDRMKDDMAGGAAVACAMRAIAALNVPIRIIGVIPIAENMPGGRAIKPGDVLKSASGKTVEVVNTDAEGRLILGDALWYAQRLGATHLVDIATLTGAITVALGRITTGLFGTPPAFVEHVRAIAERAGDRCWPLPLFEEYKDQLRSEIADMINTGGRPGGAITAALFLQEFTGGLPWIHLDIAGTSWADENKPFMPKGPTGVGVRTLIGVAEKMGEWELESKNRI